MYIVIAMAGEGKRFKQYGFKEPKFMLMAKGRPLFDWAITSLRSFYHKGSFIFIAREGFDAYIERRCKVLGINSYNIITLNALTDGQATTVMKGIQSLDHTKRLLIYNIDTYINPEAFQVHDIRPEYEGWLLLFSAPGDHWSFARLDNEGRVLEVTEKKRISPFASTGLYYFKSVEIYKDIYLKRRDAIIKDYGEVYVAPLYTTLLQKHKLVGSKVIACEDVVPLGKPEEVATFDPEFFKTYNIIPPDHLSRVLS